MKKNLILICIDGGRQDRAINCNILKKFFPNTVFFSNSITYAPYTNSSVHAVISATNGSRNGCNSYWSSYDFKNEKFKTLTNYCKDENYRTYADIHSDLIIPEQGFDDFEIYDEDKVDLSIRHPNIIEYLSKNEKPFFLYLHYESIHTTIRNEVLKKFNNFSKIYFDNKLNNEKRYDELFLNAEKYLENIFRKIKEKGLEDNSTIVIFSDHGISFGEKFGERAYGAFCYDYTIKTFFTIISRELSQKIVTSQVRHIDIMPTILEILGIKLDEKFEEIDGKSLVSELKDNKFREEFAFTETANPLEGDEPPKIPNTKSIRKSDWKLIHNEYNNTKELYNLENDPDEIENMIDKKLDIQETLECELNKRINQK